MQFLSPIFKFSRWIPIIFISEALLSFALASNSFAAESPATEPSVNSAAGSPESYSTFDSAFQAGLQEYKGKKYASAIMAFEKSLSFDPQNIAALTDLALAQFEIGQKARAIAVLRKAINLDPQFSTALNAYEFILPQLEVKEIPHEILLSESLRAKLLSQFSLFWFSILAALFVFAAGWALLSFFGRLKKSRANESPAQNFSFLGIIYCFGAIVFLCIFVLKVIDQSQTRGTVIAKEKVSALSSPETNAPALFDLYPGLEVIVEKTSDKGDNKWVQVNYPGGATGWLMKSDIYITTEN